MNEKIGILVHGRHLQTRNWSELEWGIPPHKMGVLPTLAKLVLKIGPDKINAIIFGTGASEKDGYKEAEYTKLELLRHIKHLKDFDYFKYCSDAKLNRLFRYFSDNIRPEIQSQNTVQEISNAARLFAIHGVKTVIQLSCGSHISRCIRDRLSANIPTGQEWFAIADQMFFADSTAKDVVIIEPPHRGDDPMIDTPIKPHQIVPRLFKIPVPERIRFLEELDVLLKNYRV